MDKTIDTNSHNNSQLYFRPLQAPLNTVDDSYFSLGAAQTTDPTIRLNKYDASGDLIGTGYIYDSVFNIPPPGKILIVAGGNAPDTLVYSQDRAFWSVSPNGSSLLTTTCYALAYDGFTWLAGGVDSSGGNNVISSSNGINWVPDPNSSAILTGSCNAIATNGTLWVAGGRGLNNHYPYTITNSMCFSYDTLTWYKADYAETIFTGATISAIAQNGSIWLAGSSGGTPPYSMAYADDGITWIPLAEPSALLPNCYALCWNGTLWNAGGDNDISGTILYSLNGRFWSASSSGSVIRSSVKTISWNGTLWTAGGTDLSDGGNTLAYSYDGINWYPSPSTSIFPNACNSITWDGIKWQAVGDSGVAISSDGIVWILNSQGTSILPQGNVVALYKALPFVTPGQPNPVPTTPLSLVGGLDKLGNCAIAYSTNGVSWTTSTQVPTVLASSLPTTLVWNGSLWIGGFFTDGFGSPTVGYSYDGIIWAKAITGNSGMDLVFYNAAWRPYTNSISGEFIGVGADLSFNTVLNISYDGTSWTPLSPSLSPPTMRIGQNDQNYVYPQIAYNGTVWIMTGAGRDVNPNNSSIAYSSDGISWYDTSGSAIFTELCGALVWNGSIWVAGGRNNTRAVVAYSSDGIKWTEGTLNGIWVVGTACDIFTIAWNGTLFTIGGTGDNNRSNTGTNIGYSYDGINWYPAQYTFTEANTINSITWNGSLWVATGISNPLLEGYLGTLFYSYSGVEWYISPDVNLIFQLGEIVASNRLNPANGNTLPPPVYNQGVTTTGGSVMYSTGNNNLYKSRILNLDETNRVLAINQTNRTYSDLDGNSITAALELSGGAITVNTGASVPGLYLTSHNSTQSGGRIELNDVSGGSGWQIDNYILGGNHLQINSYITGEPKTIAIDISKNACIGIGTNANGAYSLNISSNIYISGNLTVKGNKSFQIDHPNPKFTDTHYLRHCCIEGPTRGDNLYRWILRTENKSCVQTLPSYSPYLNEGWHFFVSAEDSFGTGYVTLSPCETFFTLSVNEEGTYSVIGVATRKDRDALKFDEKGVEYRKAC